MKKGFVYLVGAGPGRADLITVRGAEVLGKADCIIYDKLANPALLKFARTDAEIVHVPKRVGKDSATQVQINQLLLDKTTGGRTVVRLKGGDPCVFGRATEELVTLVEAGIDFEIVPGITSGLAASAYTGIMLTDRQYSSQLTFVTGREADDKQDSNIDWHLLAKFHGTILFYMGMGNLDKIARNLMENGASADTPAAVVSDVSLPKQRIVRAKLDSISEACAEQGIEPPAIIVIGDVAGSDTRFNWFEKMPLFGQNIVITRDSKGNADTAEKILLRGGNPICFDTIKIKPLTDSGEFVRALTDFNKYDWFVFTSANGVEIFFDAIKRLGKDARIFYRSKIAVIGERTAEKLAKFGIKADFIPSVFTSKELAAQLINFTDLQGKKILLLRSQLATNELVEMLGDVGAQVANVPVYTAVPQQQDSAGLMTEIKAGKINWLTFASPSAVDAFFEQIQPKVINSAIVRVASVGPVTTSRLEQLGVNVDVTAAEHTIDGLIDTIEQESLSSGKI